MRSNKVNVLKNMLGMILVAPVMLSLSLFAVEPVHYWELDENDTAGSIYEDTGLIGGADGTCTSPDGCPSPSDGQVFGAQSFDGIDDVIEVNGTGFDWKADENATIELWMKSSKSQYSVNDVMMGRSQNGNLKWYIGIDNENAVTLGHIRAYIADGGPSVSGKTIVNNEKWNHIAYVLTPNMVKIYVNGKNDFNISRSAPTDLSCDTNVTIGTLHWSSPNWSYAGQLDDIKLYSTALNESTINEHYMNGFAPHLKEVAPVNPTPTTNTEPAYTFASDEAGDISYQGCTSDTNLTAVVGNNPIIFGTLEIGVYDDCNITVTDADGNVSNPLTVEPFEIIAEPTTDPTVPDTTVPDAPVISSGGGGCTYNPDSKNFDMMFLLMIALGLFYPFRRRFIK